MFVFQVIDGFWHPYIIVDNIKWVSAASMFILHKKLFYIHILIFLATLRDHTIEDITSLFIR